MAPSGSKRRASPLLMAVPVLLVAVLVGLGGMLLLDHGGGAGAARTELAGSGPSTSTTAGAPSSASTPAAAPTSSPAAPVPSTAAASPTHRRTSRPSATSTPRKTHRPTHSPTATGQPVPSAPAAGGNSSFAAQVLALTNQQRAANGCKALTVNATLTAVAQAHSVDMAVHNYFSHDSQNGQSPFDRMTAAGYHYSAAGENIAAGQRTPADVMTSWMNSPGHRANILNCTYTQIGIGYATGGSYGTYWTQDFGKPL